MTSIDREEFDLALLEAGFSLAADKGWPRFSLVEAAQQAGLPIDEVRGRFPFRHSLLMRLGRLADESAFRDDGLNGSVRERVFDLFMRRFDVFQQYREGIRAVLQALPTDRVSRCFSVPQHSIRCAGWAIWPVSTAPALPVRCVSTVLREPGVLLCAHGKRMTAPISRKPWQRSIRPSTRLNVMAL